MARGIAARVTVVIGGLLVFGLFLRLLVAILKPVLPVDLWTGLSAGWDLLYSLVASALPAIFAVLILAAIVWIVMARRGPF